MTDTAEKRDLDLKMEVIAEMVFDPSIKLTDVDVLVKDGVVTLYGHVRNHGERMKVVRAAMRVAGVIAVADEIDVDVPKRLAWFPQGASSVDNRLKVDGDLGLTD